MEFRVFYLVRRRGYILKFRVYFMEHIYKVSGMHCASCVDKITDALRNIPGVVNATITLNPPEAKVEMKDHISTAAFKNAVQAKGAYDINDKMNEMIMSSSMDLPEVKASTYKPIILIALYLIGGVVLHGIISSKWNAGMLMSDFMGGFFIVFSFFKMLDIAGFANSYSTYDIVAAKVKAYGYIYPFIELALGIAFLARFNPMLTNTITLVVMTVSIIGVLQSVMNKKKIQCACLGTVFNLPMSTVTIIEDGLMIVMSAAMLFLNM